MDLRIVRRHEDQTVNGDTHDQLEHLIKQTAKAYRNRPVGNKVIGATDGRSGHSDNQRIAV